MKKIGDVTSTADKNGEWTNGNVAAGIAPTILEAGWLNSVQREILGVIIAAGMQQDKNDDTQLSKAISKIISGGNYATAEDLKKYLAKDQNGADIPNKDTFIKNLGLGDVIKSPLIAIPGGADVLTYFPGKPTGFYSSGADLNNTPEPAAWRNFIWLNHGSDRYGQLICLWGGGKSAVRSLNAAEWDSKWSVALSDADIVDVLGNSQKKVISQKKVTEELQAESLLTKIKTVDGANSGLDADLLRGLPADFESYLTPNGRQKLPSGLIIQWGNKTISPDSTETVNFPAAFPRRVFVVVGNPHSANYSQSTATINQTSYAKGSFSVKNNSTTNQVDFHYITLGE